MAYHADGEEENLERPAKRPSSDQSRFKRRRISQVPPVDTNDVAVPDIPISGHESMDPNPGTNVSGPIAPITSRSEPWKSVMDAARPFAPRVGNARCPADSTAWQLAQEILQGHSNCQTCLYAGVLKGIKFLS